jgi:hypothetical protein
VEGEVIYHGPEQECASPTKQDVFESIKNLKNNKAPGQGGICAELIKNGDMKLWEEIYKLVQTIWISEKMPEDWNISVICPICKKGDKLQCTNYRGISLLNICYKCFTS